MRKRCGLRRRTGASVAVYGAVVGLVALGVSVAVSQTGGQVRGITASVAGSVNAVDGALSGNGGPGYQGAALSDQNVGEYDAMLTIDARGFRDPEGDALDYSLSLTGGLQPGDFTVQKFPDGVVVDGTPSGDGTLAVVATDPIGRRATAGPVEVTVTPNQAPVIEALPSPTRFTQGADAILDYEIGDPEGDGLTYTVTGLPGASHVATTDGVRVTASSLGPGTYHLDLRATDTHDLATDAARVSVTITPISCLTLHQADPGAGDGVYTIDPDGPGGQAPFDAYCEMDSYGGGWTMVVAAYEDDPFLDWTEGRQADYDPTLDSRTSLMLAETEIPAHTQVGFGHGYDVGAVDITTSSSGFVYTTGDLDARAVHAISGHTYDIHRDRNAYYGGHNPDDASPTTNYPDWANTLTFDRTASKAYSWAFSPRRGHSGYDGDRADRGYAMNGQKHDQIDNFGWTVWVR